MSLPVILACLWAVVAAGVAMLPMRAQYVPGLVLLLAAPALIAWLSLSVGWWVGVLALAAFASMFRNPMRYFWARARGRAWEGPL